MAREKNECAKMRKKEDPYEIWVRGDWEWRVLKKYQSPSNEAKNEYAVWMCAVKSPMTYGGWDMGDTYVNDVVRHATKVPESKMKFYLEGD